MMQFFVIFLILCVTTATAFKIIPTLALRKSTTLSSIQEDIEISSIQQIEKNGLNIALKSITAAATTLLGTAVTRALAEDAPKKVKKPKVLETDLGIKYIEIKKGSGPLPIDGDLVVINYSAFLSNGQMFDTTEVKGKKPLAFTLGKKQIIPGLESVIEYMQPGAEVTCSIPAKFAYGDKGIKIKDEYLVPPGETLNYAIKLKSAGVSY